MLLMLLFGLLFVSAAVSLDTPDVWTPEEIESTGAATVSAIDDPRRQANAQQIVDDLIEETREFHESFSSAGEELEALFKDHEAGYDDAYLVLNEVNAEWVDMQKRMIDFQFSIREQMTEDEWISVYGDRTDNTTQAAAASFGGDRATNPHH